MINYSQKDPRWGKMLIGSTNLDMAHWGCLVTALACFMSMRPDEVLKILNKGNAFDREGELNHYIAAKLLNLIYLGSPKNKPTENFIIARTDHFKKDGVPKHFFVVIKNDQIIDPLDGRIKRNHYHIVDYRWYEKKEKSIKNMAKATFLFLVGLFGYCGQFISPMKAR